MFRLVKIKVTEDIRDFSGNSMLDQEYYAVQWKNDCHADIGANWLWVFTSGQFEILEEIANKETKVNKGSGLVQSLGAKPNKITIDF